jgi:hypothetical protein
LSEEKPTYLPEMAAPVLTPDGSTLVARRNGVRTLLPSTWLNRSVRLEYVDAGGNACSTTAALLDFCPVGPVLRIDGARTVLAWERLVLVELVED